MKRSVHLILIFLIIGIANECKGQTDTLTNKLCNTWVAYKEIKHQPRSPTKKITEINKVEYDSIQFLNDHTVLRYTRKLIYDGNWNYLPDSDKFIVDFKRTADTYYSRKTITIALDKISDTEMEMHVSYGKEGEWSLILFRKNQ